MPRQSPPHPENQSNENGLFSQPPNGIRVKPLTCSFSLMKHRLEISWPNISGTIMKNVHIRELLKKYQRIYPAKTSKGYRILNTFWSASSLRKALSLSSFIRSFLIFSFQQPNRAVFFRCRHSLRITLDFWKYPD